MIDQEKQASKPLVVAYVLSLNEERHIGEVVANLRQVAEIVVVVDSGSKDRTVELAQEAGATVWIHPFENYAAQRRWGISKIIDGLSPSWILCLDADERLSDALAQEIKRVVIAPDSADVYLIRFSLQFSGRRLRFGGFARTRLVRLFKPGSGQYENRAINDHFIPDPSASVRTLKHRIVHHDVSSWERYIEKHNMYSTREARARLFASMGAVEKTPLSQALRYPHLRRRWMREQILSRLPAKGFFRFIQLYFVYGGFLDGRAGFNIALFMSWQEMTTDLKFRELIDQQESDQASPSKAST